MNSLTTARVSIIKDGSIDLKGLEEAIGISPTSNALLIGTASKFIRIIPIHSSSILHVRVSFSGHDFSNAARGVLQKLKNLGVSMVHSTGFCPIADACLWEGFFEGTYKSKIDEFVSWLKDQELVLEVETFTLSL